jgi:hypothetical protein
LREQERVVDDATTLGRELQLGDLAQHAVLDRGVVKRALAGVDLLARDVARRGDREVHDQLAAQALGLVKLALVAALDEAGARLHDLVDLFLGQAAEVAAGGAGADHRDLLDPAAVAARALRRPGLASVDLARADEVALGRAAAARALALAAAGGAGAAELVADAGAGALAEAQPAGALLAGQPGELAELGPDVGRQDVVEGAAVLAGHERDLRRRGRQVRRRVDGVGIAQALGVALSARGPGFALGRALDVLGVALRRRGGGRGSAGRGRRRLGLGRRRIEAAHQVASGQLVGPGVDRVVVAVVELVGREQEDHVQEQRERQRRDQEPGVESGARQRLLDRRELEVELVVARLIEIDHAPVARADRGGAEVAGRAVAALAAAADELVDVALGAVDADRAPHRRRQGQQVAAIAGAEDRELRRQRQIRNHERRGRAGAEGDRLVATHPIGHDLAAPDEGDPQRDWHRGGRGGAHSLLSSMELTISGMKDRRCSEARSSSSLAR